MQIKTKEILIKTKKGPQFIDITDEVSVFVESSGIKNGQVLVYSQHTTAAIKINENEPLLIKDMEKFLSRMAPQGDFYNHNDFRRRKVNMCDGECANGHSHCQHLLLTTSETIPLMKGKMDLGIWQRIFLIELDRARPRSVMIQVLGQ